MVTVCRLMAGGAETVSLGEGSWRALHVMGGGLKVAPADGPARTIAADEGLALGRTALELEPLGQDALWHLWEIGRAGPAPASPATGLRELLVHDLADTPCLGGPAVSVRLERVDLRPGVETPVHTHAGPGLRVLVEGALRAEVGDAKLSLARGDAWLERGPDEPVVGRTDPHRPTAFVRLMLLPEDRAGKDSFIHWHETETASARPASYRRYFEERVIV